MRILKVLAAVVMSAVSISANAVLKVDITRGNVDPIPIAINAFYDQSGAVTEASASIRSIIEADLVGSSMFRIIPKEAYMEDVSVDKVPDFTTWRQIGAIALLVGKVVDKGSKITVDFRLYDPSTQRQIDGSSLTFNRSDIRKGAHKISDKVFESLTGDKGHFDTKIAFVSESGPFDNRIKKLAIMDYDGFNFKELTDGRDLVITPRFDRAAQKIIYMSYNKMHVPQVYVLDIASGRRSLLGNFPGMSFSPRFSPDGKDILMSIATEGTTDIYEMDIKSKNVKRLTTSRGSINTSPTYSPDGKYIVFCSDRDGSPQLYIMDRDGSNVRKISSGGGTYNTPTWSPRGDYIAFTRIQGGEFYIGVMRSDGSGERMLTSSWMDEGPTWSPNGRVIMFARQQRGGSYSINTVDVTGHNERVVKLPMDASDPFWSSTLN